MGKNVEESLLAPWRDLSSAVLVRGKSTRKNVTGRSHNDVGAKLFQGRKFRGKSGIMCCLTSATTCRYCEIDKLTYIFVASDSHMSELSRGTSITRCQRNGTSDRSWNSPSHSAVLVPASLTLRGHTGVANTVPRGTSSVVSSTTCRTSTPEIIRIES